MKTIFSGIQPTGQLHIGNYFGALKKWVEFQNSYQCIFGIVDLHALTEGPEPKKLKQNILETALDFLASGLDPKKSILMIQSYVPEHSELAWIFNCITPISKLERVPTFKDKALQFKNNLNMGLLDYPVLMASDILIYKADAVPVGQDQIPHLELTREIARSFNDHYGFTFPEPREILSPTPKIMNLNDPTKKMSKSLGPKSYIALADTPELIEQKIKSAVTAVGDESDIIKKFLDETRKIHEASQAIGKDTYIDGTRFIVKDEKELNKIKNEFGEVKFQKYMSFTNLFILLDIFGEKKDVEKFINALENQSIRFSELKELLSKEISFYFQDFRKKREALAKNPQKVWKILEEGSQKAQAIAQKTLQEVKEKVGLR